MLRKPFILFIFALLGAVFAFGGTFGSVKQDWQNDSPKFFSYETDAARYAFYIPGLLQRTYDVSGQKSEILLGTSILGSPSFDRSTAGISTVERRFPAKFAGIFTTKLSYDDFHPGLNGENGILREEEVLVALDTPVTEIVWERGTFEGNAFRLDFRRQLVDSLRLDLGLSSHSNKESGDYVYTAVANQPYFALGRDSSQVPFGGRNISMNAMNVRPTVTWLFGPGELMLRANLFFLDYHDVSRDLAVQDTADYSIYYYPKDLYTTYMSGQSYDAKLTLYPIKNLTFGTSIGTGHYEIEYDSLPKMIDEIKDTIIEYTNILGEILDSSRTDTTWRKATETVQYETYSGTVFASYKTLLNPALYFEYEFLTLDNDDPQDKELGYAQIGDSFGPVTFRTLYGYQRNSSLNDSVYVKPTYALELDLDLFYHFRIHANYRHDNRFPEPEELRLTNRGRYTYPNENLKAEVRSRSSAELQWRAGGIFYGLGIRHEEVEHAIKERWVVNSGLDDPASAFQLVNLKQLESYDWTLRLGFSLGNWALYGERSQTLERTAVGNKFRILDTPELYYKGSVVWKDRFVQNRLGVSVRFDFQWFGNRYDCVFVQDSLAEYINESRIYSEGITPENEDSHLAIVKLNKYLALDFEARMNILTFDLYTRIENLNHSQYMPAGGYTPEGLRFMYGIVWSFRN